MYQATAVLEQTRTLIPVAKAGARVAANRLCVLLGIPLEDLQKKTGPGPIPLTPPEVVIGIPADLVRPPPDAPGPQGPTPTAPFPAAPLPPSAANGPAPPRIGPVAPMLP